MLTGTGLELAQLHSLAVDYAKTGYPAKMNEEYRVRRWPHYMEKRNKGPGQVYTSEKILGQLYDHVERVDFVPHYSAQFDDRVSGSFQLDEALVESAKAIKKDFDFAMRRIMAQHSIGTEFEVWSTFVLSHDSRTRDYKFHEEIGRLSQGLKDTYRAHCIKVAGGKEFHVLGPLVVAMYVATRDEIRAGLTAVQSRSAENAFLAGKPPLRPEMPLITFPWIFPEVMGRIARHGGLLNTPSMKSSTIIKTPSKPSPWVEKERGQVNSTDDILTRSGVTHRGEVLELFGDSHPAKEDMSNEALPKNCKKAEPWKDNVEDSARPTRPELGTKRGVENQPTANTLDIDGASHTRPPKKVIDEEIEEDFVSVHPTYLALEKLSLRQ